ncbi:MAG: hypothetical protein ACFFB5_21775 [Promethearchaeota archaeon]
MSSIIGLTLWRDDNPFRQVYKKQKIAIFLQIAVVIAILSFLSSFYFIADLFSSLSLTLIIVICPFGLVLFRKREKRSVDFIILATSLIIILFILQAFGYFLMEPLSFRTQCTVFAPLSYPLMVSHQETIVSVPNPENMFHYHSSYVIGIILPIFGIPISSDYFYLSFNNIEYNERIWENLRLQYQLFIFTIFFLLNYVITIITLKFWAKQENQMKIADPLSENTKSKGI